MCWEVAMQERNAKLVVEEIIFQVDMTWVEWSLSVLEGHCLSSENHTCTLTVQNLSTRDEDAMLLG